MRREGGFSARHVALSRQGELFRRFVTQRSMRANFVVVVTPRPGNSQ